MQVAAGVEDVVGVSAGESHTLFLTSNGTVYASGYNNNGQLGDGTMCSAVNCVITPVQVATGVADVVQVAAELYHSLMLGSCAELLATQRGAQTQATRGR